jgi:NADPH:quinone reductase
MRPSGARTSRVAARTWPPTGSTTTSIRRPSLGHAAADPDVPLTGDDLWYRNAGMLGFAVGPYLKDNPGAARPAAESVLPLLVAGRLTQRVDELPLTDAAEAHRRLEAHEVPGRIVLAV